MANLWITGDSWGMLDKTLPDTHWVNFYKEHFNLKNMYCLAEQGLAQDMINFTTHNVIKNRPWKGREATWSNYDDHLIVFPVVNPSQEGQHELFQWRDHNHLKHIVREVQNCNIYGGYRYPTYQELWPDESIKGREQINHLDTNKHLKYWHKVQELM
jgi:hypothetical protein|tara:strand:+ start:608 stop:1078 length:471 start_codon:yes stop_codon:yes gene_type:complete